MTISAEDRKQELRSLLMRLADDVGDRAVTQVVFRVDDPEYAHWQATSWMELVTRYYLERVGLQKPAIGYRLTASGWFRGLELAGKLELEVKPRAIAIIQQLSALVNDRSSHDGASMTVEALAVQANLPPGWVENAVQCPRVFRTLFPNRLYDMRFVGRNVTVRSTFGHEHIPADEI